MDDIISRQATIDAICKDWCGEKNCDCSNPFDQIKDDYYHCDGCYDVEIIKDLPSAQTWIPVTERLPRKKEVVLITNSYGNVRCGQFRGRTGTNGMYWIWKGNTLEEVIAWLPLPKPYREQGK